MLREFLIVSWSSEGVLPCLQGGTVNLFAWALIGHSEKNWFLPLSWILETRHLSFPKIRVA